MKQIIRRISELEEKASPKEPVVICINKTIIAGGAREDDEELQVLRVEEEVVTMGEAG